MMVSKIQTGKSIIVDSGTVISYSKESSVILFVDIADDFSFSIEISFENREGEERGIYRTVDVDTNFIKYVCVNFDNTLGTGTTIPLELASYKGKKISMHLWSAFLGQKDSMATRKIEYSIYREI